MKYLFLLKLFLSWRTALFLPVILAPLFIPSKPGYMFIFPWANFDGIHYLSIAQAGYVGQAAFFPFFPLLIRVFGGSFWAGFLIANISFLLALFTFYKLIKLDYSEETAKQSVLFLLIFPTAFFFGCVYSESLFFLLLSLSFYFARKSRWFLAAFFAMLLSATRLVGILILPALVWEYIEQIKGKRLKIKDFLCFTIVPFGLLIYSWYNLKKWGDALYFVHAHGQLANSRTVDRIILFPQTVYRYGRILFTLPPTQYEWWIALLELSVFIFFATLLCIVWRKKIRTSYLVFSLLAFLLPVLSGTFSGLPRYALVIFPVFIALALLKSKPLKATYVIVGIILQFLLLLFFSRGYFVA